MTPIRQLLRGIADRDPIVLGQAITLIESQHPEDQAQALQLFEQLPKSTGQSRRIGITGPPGAGKSSFIEAFGALLLEDEASLAILSIDPSSQRNKGSILGDKTRMEALGRHQNVFIRPSAAGASLGGIHAQTRAVISVLEAAGFDHILVETVGVGQSEVAVQEMVDCLLLLLTPAGGDELQGIKRGVVEMADLLLVNKSDGDLLAVAQATRKAYAQALHLFPLAASGWAPKVMNISALEGKGLDTTLAAINAFFEHMISTGNLEQRREQQAQAWFLQRLDQQIKSFMAEDALGLEKMKSYKLAVQRGEIRPLIAAHRLFSDWKKTL